MSGPGGTQNFILRMRVSVQMLRSSSFFTDRHPGCCSQVIASETEGRRFFWGISPAQAKKCLHSDTCDKDAHRKVQPGHIRSPSCRDPLPWQSLSWDIYEGSDMTGKRTYPRISGPHRPFAPALEPSPSDRSTASTLAHPLPERLKGPRGGGGCHIAGLRLEKGA